MVDWLRGLLAGLQAGLPAGFPTSLSAGLLAGLLHDCHLSEKMSVNRLDQSAGQLCDWLLLTAIDSQSQLIGFSNGVWPSDPRNDQAADWLTVCLTSPLKDKMTRMKWQQAKFQYAIISHTCFSLWNFSIDCQKCVTVLCYTDFNIRLLSGQSNAGGQRRWRTMSERKQSLSQLGSRLLRRWWNTGWRTRNVGLQHRDNRSVASCHHSSVYERFPLFKTFGIV